VFSFTCESWQDEGDVINYSYQSQLGAQLRQTFSYFDVDGNERFLASSTTSLPSGSPDASYNVTVRGYVTDVFDLSSYHDFTVKVN